MFIIRGRYVWERDLDAPIRSTPLSTLLYDARIFSISFDFLYISSAMGRISLLTSVSWSCLLVLRKSFVPNCFSRHLIFVVTAGCVRNSFAAALLKLFSFATKKKAIRFSRFILIFSIEDYHSRFLKTKTDVIYSR